MPDPLTLLLHLEPISMSSLFRAVAADRHTAPSARAASRAVDETSACRQAGPSHALTFEKPSSQTNFAKQRLRRPHRRIVRDSRPEVPARSRPLLSCRVTYRNYEAPLV
jgi:hypothetical protein